MTTSTNTSLGEIKLAGDLGGNNDGLAPALTNTAVTPGSYTLPVITVDSKGRITAAANGTSANLIGLIPTATAGTIGGVKVGTNLAVDGAGVLSVSAATSGTLGVASFGSGFTVTAGNVVVDPTTFPATAGTLGTVRPGSGLTVDGLGTLSVVQATSSTVGVASFNASDFTVSSGVVSLVTPIPTATNTTFGTVKSANTSNITIASGGGIDVGANVAKLDTANTFTKAQVVALVSPSFSSSVTLDCSLGNVFAITATSNFTLQNPTNVVSGGTYMLVVTQDGTGSRVITYGSNFKFGIGAVTTLTTTAGKIDIITFVAVGSSLLTTLQRGF